MRAGGLGRSNASHNGTNSSRPDEQTHALLVGSQFSNGDGSENRRNGVEESSESETDDGNEVDVDNEDLEKITVVSLFDDAEFNTVPAMLAYVKELYNFDLVSVQKQLGKDPLYYPVNLFLRKSAKSIVRKNQNFSLQKQSLYTIARTKGQIDIVSFSADGGF